MKLSTATRDRLKSHAAAGQTLEDVVVTALEHLERADFWETASAVASSETDVQRKNRRRVDAEIDRWMDDLD